MKKIIITGGTGTIGSELKNILITKGYNVIVLTRSKTKNNESIFFWDFNNKIIDKEILKDTYALIHLAGANIAEKRWSKERKEELLTSRVKSLQFLFDKFNEIQSFPKILVSSSGVGYYGANISGHIYQEDNLPGNDFIGSLCEDWEQAALNFEQLTTRVVILRTGVVLSAAKNGMLGKILPIFKLGLGSAIGSGKQTFPWIHLEDIVSCFTHSIEHDNLKGIFNAVAPEYISNKDFSETLAKVLKKPFFLPPVPSFLLKLIFGELACILIQGSKISSEKIVTSNFKFKYNNSSEALKNILSYK